MIFSGIYARGAVQAQLSDRAFVQAIGTRFLLIDGGKIVEVDAPDAFYRMLG